MTNNARVLKRHRRRERLYRLLPFLRPAPPSPRLLTSLVADCEGLDRQSYFRALSRAHEHNLNNWDGR